MIFQLIQFLAHSSGFLIGLGGLIARLGYMEQPSGLLLRSTGLVFTSCCRWLTVLGCIDNQANVVVGCG
jgi:hypothetical protein